MKRLLLVSYVFPPAPSPGAQRPGYMARYLPHFGWDVTVLTNTSGAPPFSARVVTTGGASGGFEERLREKVSARVSDPNSLPRRLLRGIKETVLFPDATAPWISKALAAGTELLRTESFDAIFSTALPPSAHVVGWILSRRSGLPWVADYRDQWAGNYYMYRRPFYRQLLEEWLERGMIRSASALTTISQPIAAQLRRLHRRRDVTVIPNAYDPADWEGIPNLPPPRFDLCFTGSMYNGKRSPDVLFQALAEMRAAEEAAAMQARVHFYGATNENVQDRAAAHGLSLIVRQHGMVPRAAAMRAQRNAAALLIFLSTDPTTISEMGSKYLEYIGARRPIIGFGPATSPLRSFIESNRLGWYAANADEAKQALRAAYARFCSGAFEMVADPGVVPSARDMAFNFADLFDRAIGLDRRLDDVTFRRGA